MKKEGDFTEGKEVINNCIVYGESFSSFIDHSTGEIIRKICNTNCQKNDNPNVNLPYFNV